MGKRCYEKFPLRTVILSNSVSLLTYLIGAYVFLQLGAAYAVFYIAYIAFLEIRLLTISCRYCYYHGKTCAFGKGRCSALITRKGDPKKFLRKEITMKDLVPDFLVFILPLLAGVALLIFSFSWTILILMILILALSTAGTGFVRGSLACRHCKQREMGCPALKLFEKK